MSLGRGLGAILEEVEESYINDISSHSELVKEISVSSIRPNPFQPRKFFDEEALNDLSKSIKEHGLLQPIVVVKEGDSFLLIAGERRLRATKLAGFSSIRAIIATVDMDKLRELAIIENIQREDLNSIELAISYKELIDDYGITHEELADIVKKSRVHVTNTLRLLTLSSYTQDMISESKISSGHAKVLVGLSDDEQKKVVNTIIGQKLSVREVEQIVQKIKSGTATVPVESIKKEGVLDLNEVRSYFQRNFEPQVAIKKNQLQITFESDEQVQTFLNELKRS